MKMTPLPRIIIGLTALLALSGCERQALPEGAKIQINVPDEPHPGSRTTMITFDVDDGRDVFVRLFNSTRRVGMCNPSTIETSNRAHPVMTVTYWGEKLDARATFHILTNQTGEWITAGFGGVEVYDAPEGFPEYRYTRRSLRQVKAWYEKYVPPAGRKR
jgi:hypothetical protein